MPANRSFPGKKAKQIAGQKERWDHSILSRILVNFSTTLLEQINHEKKGKKSSRLHRFHWPPSAMSRSRCTDIEDHSTICAGRSPSSLRKSNNPTHSIHRACPYMYTYRLHLPFTHHFFFWYERKETLQSTRKKKKKLHTHTHTHTTDSTVDSPATKTLPSHS